MSDSTHQRKQLTNYFKHFAFFHTFNNIHYGKTKHKGVDTSWSRPLLKSMYWVLHNLRGCLVFQLSHLYPHIFSLTSKLPSSYLTVFSVSGACL